VNSSTAQRPVAGGVVHAAVQKTIQVAGKDTYQAKLQQGMSQ
jgi:hypothetical protein